MAGAQSRPPVPRSDAQETRDDPSAERLRPRSFGIWVPGTSPGKTVWKVDVYSPNPSPGSRGAMRISRESATPA